MNDDILLRIIMVFVLGSGGWGWGLGEWGLGIGDWAQSPIPNPQFPIPNPQTPKDFKNKYKKNFFY